MFGINYKMWLSENTEKKFQEYLKILDADKSNWGDIVIDYGSAEDPRFEKYFEKGLCNHPKRMYRPGNTIICHFTPIAADRLKDYKDGAITEEEWNVLCLNTRRISRGITDSITSTLQSFGREVSLLTESEKWSHTCGAEIAGLGSFEKVGDMYLGNGLIGSMGTVITEVSF